MSVQTDVLATFLVITVLLDSTRSGSFNNRTKMPEEKPLTNYSLPPHITTASNNRTNGSIQSTTATTESVHTKQRTEDITPTTMPHSEENVTSRPTRVHIPESVNAGKVQTGAKHMTVLSVLLALGIGLIAVGVVSAVVFVRWKRIKKMKKGFQEEMATICLHDELASEALYSSWKPFMDTNDSNKRKLVIETSNPRDPQNTHADT